MISKLITCFINGFTVGMKSQSMAYLLIGSAHIYWSSVLEGEVHSIWDLWTMPSRMQGQCYFRSWAGRAVVFSWVQKI